MIWLRCLPHHRVDPALRDWLTDAGSLTARLRAAFPDLALTVLRQTLARPALDEASLIGQARPGYALIREVLLHAGGRPLVFAHSVAQISAVRGAWQSLTAQGSRPLGETLFSDPSICRGALTFAAIPRRHPFHRTVQRAAFAAHLPDTLWARRSLFTRRGKRLLVNEIFLPDFLLQA